MVIILMMAAFVSQSFPLTWNGPEDKIVYLPVGRCLTLSAHG